MNEEEILEALVHRPLSPKAARRAALHIVTNFQNLTPFESAMISHFQAEEDMSLCRQHLWEMLDASGANSIENARQRLFVCMTSDHDNLDEQLAEMLYHWSSVAGIEETIVNLAIEQEIASYP